jgi:hypothetical protein
MILRLARNNEGVFIDELVLLQRKHEPQIVNPVDKWLKYDALLFKRIDAEWDLANFHPFSATAASADDQALALLQKGVILFRRKHYQGSMNALGRYRHHLDARPSTRMERRIAAGLLGCRYGIGDLLTGPMGGWVIEAMRGSNWPLSMRIALASQVRWRAGRAALAGDLRYALELVRFSSKAFGILATAAVLGSRYKALGWGGLIE